MTKRMILIGIGIVLLLSLGGLAYYYYSMNKNNEDKLNISSEKKTASCGEISADNAVTEGISPFAPTLRINAGYDTPVSKRICQWSIDGALSHTSYPVKEVCIFGGRNIITKGKHTIGFKNTSNSCTKSIDIVVK